MLPSHEPRKLEITSKDGPRPAIVLRSRYDVDLARAVSAEVMKKGEVT
jgi:hypothetical protein